MRYVNKRMIVAINKLCIELSGGSPVSGNTNLSAGQNLGFVEGIRTNKIFGKKVYSSIFDQAGAYFFYILKNHPFIDGNKRTALAVAITFLEWNGKFFAPMDDDDDVVDFYNNNVDDDNDYLAVTDQLLDELTDTIKSQGIVFREAYTEGANDLDTLYGGAVPVGDKKDESKFSIEETGQYLGYIPDTNQYSDSLNQVAAYQRDEDDLHSHDVVHHTAIRLHTPPPAPTQFNGQFNNQFGYNNSNSFSSQENRPASTSGYSTYSAYQPRLPESSNPFSRNGSIRRMFK